MKLQNLIGKKYGRLLVIKKMKSINGKTKWLCKCDCGNEKSIRQTSLLSGTITCGCSRRSRGELKIAKLLEEYNIPFEIE